MAVTKGHGNPDWTREEVILALNLFNELKGVIPSPNNEYVIALSDELRSLPYHQEASKVASFRNPVGVTFKLQNLRQVASGKGLAHTARADKEVWNDFGDDPAAVAEAAARIRSGLKIAQVSSQPDDEFEFNEGRAVTEAHKRIERNKSIRKKLLKNRKEEEKLHCEICKCNGLNIDENLRESIFEAHHKKPIAQTGEIKTKLSDMALLCANCHRLVHRLISNKKQWISIDEAINYLYPKI